MEAENISQEILKEKISQISRDEAVKAFTEIGLPIAPVYHVNETVEDPQLKARSMFTEIEHPLAGKIKIVNFPIKFSETPVKINTAAPTLGQHNEEILGELLSFDEGKIKDLIAKGVISY